MKVPLGSHPPTLTLGPRQPVSDRISVQLLVLGFHMNGTIQHVDFCVWLLLVSMIVRAVCVHFFL